MAIEVIGAQVYVFGEEFRRGEGQDEALAGLAAAGYGAVEGFLEPGGDDRARLDAHGLVYAAAHATLPQLDDLDGVLRHLEARGGRDVCCSGLREWHRRTAADYREAAERLNERGARLRAHGVWLHYHNHDFEFERVEGDQTGMDLLLGGLDSQAVTLCVDAGWVWRAGGDAAVFLTEHAGRVGVVHLRDFRGAESVPLGRGDVDQGPVVAALPRLTALRWTVVEQDPGAPDPGGDMATSRAFLRQTYGL